MNSDYKRISNLIKRIGFAPASECHPEYFYHRFSNKTSEFTVEYALKFHGTNEDWLEEISFIGKLLIGLHHASNSETVTSLVALLVLQNPDMRDELFVKKSFQLIKKVKIKQYHFFPQMTPGFVYDLSFSSFRFGLIEFDKFRQFVKTHASSDFVDKYEKHLANKVGIEVKTQDIIILDIFQYLTHLNISITPVPNSIQEFVNCYLACCALVQTEGIKKQFDEHQQMTSAMFGIHYDIFELEKFGIFPVSIFYGFANLKSQGWVLPIESRINEFKMPDPRILKLSNAFVRDKEHLLFGEKGHYARFLRIVTEYFAAAKRNTHKNQYNHAYVDFFVGLDFLLAPDTEKSKKLKSRIALLTYEKFDNSFPAQIALMDALYDSRSNYIHNGVGIPEQHLIALTNISKTILGCILNMHERNLNTLKVSYDDWIKKIDFLVERIYTKGEFPKMKDRMDIGIGNLQFVLLNSSLEKYDDNHLKEKLA